MLIIKLEFEHDVPRLKSLQCLVIVTTINNLYKPPYGEGLFFEKSLRKSVYPKDHYVENPVFHMSPEVFLLVEQYFNNTFQCEP
jgi:hypothetical protein